MIKIKLLNFALPFENKKKTTAKGWFFKERKIEKQGYINKVLKLAKADDALKMQQQ